MTSLQICCMCMYMLSHTPAHHHWTDKLYTSLFYSYFCEEKVKFVTLKFLHLWCWILCSPIITSIIEYAIAARVLHLSAFIVKSELHV